MILKCSWTIRNVPLYSANFGSYIVAELMDGSNPQLMEIALVSRVIMAHLRQRGGGGGSCAPHQPSPGGVGDADEHVMDACFVRTWPATRTSAVLCSLTWRSKLLPRFGESVANDSRIQIYVGNKQEWLTSDDTPYMILIRWEYRGMLKTAIYKSQWA